MIVDKQTLDDLNMLGKFKPQSIFSIFNKVQTAGGERLLHDMFTHPLTDAQAITERSKLFRYFHEKQLIFPFQREQFNVVENYLTNAGGNMLIKKIKALVLRDEEYDQLRKGLLATTYALDTLKKFIESIDLPFVQSIKTILNQSSHRILRRKAGNEVELLLNGIYQLDVFIAVSNVARERNLSYATVSTGNNIGATALWHPAISNAVSNPISFYPNANLLFLTGANMAGKSTFMKAVGINVYLAHMGFPVAAQNFECCVLDGLFSSINVADNLNSGYSHFYAEVLRVKKVAVAVSEGKKMLVIFDELFKGTNVKDAYDATVQVTAAFAGFQTCFFIISTHIIEAGEALRKTHPNLQFVYLPTVMDGPVPRYTYRLTEGITADRQGMTIIENEKILEIISEEGKGV